MKTVTKVGDERYRVEWCSKLAFYPDSSDVDRDSCTMSTRSFQTLESAKAFAEEIYPSVTATFGIVEVDHQRFTAYDDGDGPYPGHWEYVGETQIFSGEWETQ